MKKIYMKFKFYCIKVLEILTSVALLALLIVLLLQIASRMLKVPIPGTMTWSTMLLMWVAFPAACLGIEKKMQLGVDLLYNLLSVQFKQWLDVVAGISIMLFAVFAMCYGGGVIAAFLLKNHEFIRFMFYLPLILSGIFMIIQGLERIISGICGISFTNEGEKNDT